MRHQCHHFRQENLSIHLTPHPLFLRSLVTMVSSTFAGMLARVRSSTHVSATLLTPPPSLSLNYTYRLSHLSQLKLTSSNDPFSLHDWTCTLGVLIHPPCMPCLPHPLSHTTHVPTHLSKYPPVHSVTPPNCLHMC